MSTPPSTTPGTTAGTTVGTPQSKDSRVRELERRIEELEALDAPSFGHFTVWDWSITIAFSLVLPLLAIWRWAS